MEVRPYLTAGAAIVTTGALVVATPAIVPSPTPPDVKISAAVPESVYADVALRFTSQELFNAIFSGFPDTTGPAGLVGVASLLTDGVPLANSFVTGGIIGLATELFGADPVAAAFLDGGIVGVATLLTEGLPLVNSFFGGGPNDTAGGIIGVADELTDGVPLVNSFVTGGLIGVASELTEGNPLANAFVNDGVIGVADLLTEGNTLVNTFVNGGFVPVTEAVLVGLTTADPVVSQGIQAFFSGYPFEDGDLPAGPAGIVGLVHYVLDRLAGNPTVPEEDALSGTTMLASGDTEEVGATQDSLLQATDTTVNPGARTFNLNVGTQLRTGAVDPVGTLDPVDTTDPAAVDTTDPTAVDTIDPVDTTEPVETTDPDPTVTPVGTNTGSGSVPAAQLPVAPTPPPATDPVVDPEVDPVDPASNEKDGEDGKLSEEELKSGNKVEPDEILLQNRSGGGGSAWDQTVQRWKDFGAKLGLGGGAAPAAPSAPDNSATDGSADGTT